MGFANGAFQAARIAIDGVTIIEDINTGKIQTTPITPSYSFVQASPTTGFSWGTAAYILNTTAVNNLSTNLTWSGVTVASSIQDAIALNTTTSTIDGKVSANSTNVATLSVTLSTTNTNDIILIFVSAKQGFGTNTLTITDTAGLTWKQRHVITQNIEVSGTLYNYTVAEFYAIASSALTNDSIKLTTNTSFTDVFMQAFGVTNVDTSSPFDTNSSIPSESTGENISSLNLAPISTSNSNTLSVGFWGGQNSSSSFVLSSAFSPNNSYTWSSQQTFNGGITSSQTLTVSSGLAYSVELDPGQDGDVLIIPNSSSTGGSFEVRNPSNTAVFTVNFTPNNVLTLNNTLDDGSGNVTFAGHLNLTTGTNKTVGQATLSAGTVTVDNTSVTSSSLIFLTNAGASGTVGTLSVGTITAGTSFVINSSSSTDTSKVNWLIVN